MRNMGRFERLKQLDKKTRNRVRAILSLRDSNPIDSLNKLRGTLGKYQSVILDEILNSLKYERALQALSPFPKKPPFVDKLTPYLDISLIERLELLEKNVDSNRTRLLRVAKSLNDIDKAYAVRNKDLCRNLITDAIKRDGWSHALLRRIVLVRENLTQDQVDEALEQLLRDANLNAVVVTSVIHSYSHDQNILTIKRSILNIADKGVVNRYSRTLSKLPVQPFAKDENDLSAYLSEVEKCSLIDAIILAKFNSHLFTISDYPAINDIAISIGNTSLFQQLVATYDELDQYSEYTFFKQSSAWLEYEPVRQYRILLDNFYDVSRDEVGDIHNELSRVLLNWVGDANLSNLVGNVQFTQHNYAALAKLELSGNATRSAIFNFWLHKSDGLIGFEKNDLLTLMGKTQDLARTIPIKPTRLAAKYADDQLVKLILLLLLAKRSKNELDSFHLRKLLEHIALNNHQGSLVQLVRSYESTHPYVSEYIYEIATEDFLAKLNKIAPHRSDIPEIRASLHEWMAEFRHDEHYRQRARAVRIDHQLNRVRNEIDDHRIYVDPSRFSSWLEDEMMIDLNSALTSTGSGKKGISISCDETLLSLVMTESYNTFCSNVVFGIASYIGRRIRHGTFHGHLYSSVVNNIEKNTKFSQLFQTQLFIEKWDMWKSRYSRAIEAIIKDRLHVYSKTKPLGLLKPEIYGPFKQEILNAAVKNISTNFVETRSVAGVDQTIIDYCWRLAESDLADVTKYLRAQQTPLKNLSFLEKEVVPAASPRHSKLVESFVRELELLIDRKLVAMFGWFKRPTIVAPKASVSMLFDAIVAEVKDTFPDFVLQSDSGEDGNDELIGPVYHLVYDSLAVVVTNAAKHGDRFKPARRKFEILQGKEKRLIVEISSAINQTDDAKEVAAVIEQRKMADCHDANLYQGKSGISKLKLLTQQRQDFSLVQYEVIGNEVKVRLEYALEH